MRRICWTIVYLVCIGLPIARASEPTAPPAELEWKGVPKAPNAPAPFSYVLPMQDFWIRLNSQITVERPAWPKANPNAVRLTVYPKTVPAIPVSIQKEGK